MIIQHKKGNLQQTGGNKKIDRLELDWFETRKRIMRKTTASGKELVLKFLDENPELTEGDILFEDEETIVAVTIKPCDCIVVQPSGMFEMASVCYEIGNKHLPLFYEQDCLLVPMDQPLFNLLHAQGYRVQQEMRQLLSPLKTSVAPHSSGTGDSLFSKILKLTSSPS